MKHAMMADKLVSYADAITAFSLVSAFTFVSALTFVLALEDTQCLAGG